jgi:hypothetical protein
MSRSVDYPSEAEAVFFFPAWESEDPMDEWESQEMYDAMVDNIQYSFRKRYPSLEKADSWIGRESRVFLENKLVQITISEYCGLCSIALVPQTETESSWCAFESQFENIARAWVNQNRSGFEKALSETVTIYRKIGTFSNGECMYEKVS